MVLSHLNTIEIQKYMQFYEMLLKYNNDKAIQALYKRCVLEINNRNEQNRI